MMELPIAKCGKEACTNPPCVECPYRLGLVRTLVNPCPRCRENHYATYDRFSRIRPGESPKEHLADAKRV